MSLASLIAEVEKLTKRGAYCEGYMDGLIAGSAFRGGFYSLFDERQDDFVALRETIRRHPQQRGEEP